MILMIRAYENPWRGISLKASASAEKPGRFSRLVLWRCSVGPAVRPKRRDVPRRRQRLVEMVVGGDESMVPDIQQYVIES